MITLTPFNSSIGPLGRDEPRPNTSALFHLGLCKTTARFCIVYIQVLAANGISVYDVCVNFDRKCYWTTGPVSQNLVLCFARNTNKHKEKRTASDSSLAG